MSPVLDPAPMTVVNESSAPALRIRYSASATTSNSFAPSTAASIPAAIPRSEMRAASSRRPISSSDLTIRCSSVSR